MAWVHNLLLLLAPVLMLRVHGTVTLAAETTIISAFHDSSCQGLLANESTNQVAADGTCEAVHNGVNSIKTIQVASGCEGI